MAFSDLVFDRTQSDVDEVKVLIEKIKVGLASASEISTFNAGMKGNYNYTDINFVSGVMNELASMLADAGYKLDINLRTDWKRKEYFRPENEEEYLYNVEKIRAVLNLADETTPNGVLSYEDANTVERILFRVNELFENMQQAYLYSGEIFAGEV